MSAKEMLAEIKQRGLIKAGNIQDELNALAVSQEEEIISLKHQLLAKTISEQNIINAFGISGEGAHSKLVIEYVHGVVAENAAISDRLQKLIQIVNNVDNSYCMCGDSMKNHAGGGCGSPTGMFDYHYNAWLESEKETPATDAAIADIGAKAIENAINAQSGKPFITDKTNGLAYINLGGIQDFAANLRAGRKG